MKLVGTPVTIQATDSHRWLVRWDDAVTSDAAEQVSFTVSIPVQAELTISEVQRYAIRRAIELLQTMLPKPD